MVRGVGEVEMACPSAKATSLPPSRSTSIPSRTQIRRVVITSSRLWPHELHMSIKDSTSRVICRRIKESRSGRARSGPSLKGSSRIGPLYRREGAELCLRRSSGDPAVVSRAQRSIRSPGDWRLLLLLSLLSMTSSRRDTVGPMQMSKTLCTVEVVLRLKWPNVVSPSVKCTLFGFWAARHRVFMNRLTG